MEDTIFDVAGPAACQSLCRDNYDAGGGCEYFLITNPGRCYLKGGAMAGTPVYKDNFAAAGPRECGGGAYVGSGCQNLNRFWPVPKVSPVPVLLTNSVLFSAPFL